MRILIFLALLVCFYAPELRAAESPWVAADHVQAKLIASGDQAVLQLRMTRGWHTYWRVPGDAGLPPRFDWAGSQNIKNVEVFWPAPKRKEELDFYTFGYDDDVSFPLDLEFETQGAPSTLAVKADVMVCKDICIPQTLELDLTIGEERSPAIEKMIEFAQRKVPKAQDIPNLKINTIVVGPEGLVLSVFSARGFEHVDVFADIDGLAFTGIPEITPDEKEDRKALIKIATPYGVENLNNYLNGKTLSVTLVAGKDAIEKVTAF